MNIFRLINAPMKPVRHFIILFFGIAIFQGCSGGSGGNNSTIGSVLVNAGADQSVSEQTEVTLTGQGSGETDALTFSWSVAPSLDITHADTTVATAIFTAPITTEVVSYTFTLTVTDGEGNSGSDTVEYLINPVNVLPSAYIEVVTIDDFNSNVFPAGYNIVLDGSESDDPDTADESNPIAAYSWQQTAGESVLDNISTLGDTLTFNTPILADTNTITFALTVTDDEGAEDTETITLNVQSIQQTLPTADAGLDHEVFSGESIVLNGLANTTVDSSTPLVINWVSDTLDTVYIDSASSIQTFAIAPLVTEELSLTFTLEVEDAIANHVEDSITVNVLPLPIQPLNDTGVILQATSTTVAEGHQADYPGQDGQRGQDIININDISTKAGRGQQGFDFTALDEIGDEVDDISQGWRCVRDNITGLIWEVKTAVTETDLHSSNHSYNWYQIEDDGEYSGEESVDETSCSGTNCNTTEYVEDVNEAGLCNFRDWRLPTHDELLSIVHYGKDDGQMVDTEYFPNTTESLGTEVWYWTTESSADGMSGTEAHASWAIDFASGNDNFLLKSTAARIRLVRAGR
ncbi:DUF1566 domain-containing protein [Paraglaciecola marina]|uniref:Lcl C-terminal domain-containing protein n=1 Tax=Paraglaciecola marina TaxID=2500157 RepID=UPI001EF14068|nr:DUF1566 domain-containing protein [Paraglaciecola marina]